MQYCERLLRALLTLKSAGSLPLEQTAPGSGVWRFRTRAAGWPVVIDLDSTVFGLRAYHGNDVIATGAVSEQVLGALIEDGAKAAAAPPGREALADLRAVIADWKSANARIFMKAPDVARHPDGWNNS